MLSLMSLCLFFMPIVLLVFGVLGVLGIAQAGPREMPKKHPMNRRLSFILLFLSLGLFMLNYQNKVLSGAGIVICATALILYTVNINKARKEFPEMSPDEYYKWLKTRYRFMGGGKDKPDTQDQPDQQSKQDQEVK